MSRRDKFHSRYNPSGYKVIFDSSRDQKKKSPRHRSRSPYKRRTPSPEVLKAIVHGHISEELEVLNRSYKHIVDNFKVRKEEEVNPYEFSVVPVLMVDDQLSKELEDSRKLRNQARQVPTELYDQRLKVMMAQLKEHEIDQKLKSLKQQIQSIS